MKYEQIKEIIKDFQESNLTYLEIESDGSRVSLEKDSNNKNNKIEENVETLEDESKKNEDSSKYYKVKSPLVGTFYAANGPDEEPFVQVGEKVSKGDVLCIVEAMKIMNEIKSPVEGFIKAICLEDGAVVEFDQTVMEIV